MRIRTLLAGLTALAAVGLLATSVTASATSDRTSKATYSQPYWFPLRDSQEAMDCAWSNPGCAHGHTDKAITWLTHDTAGVYHNVRVYAAGAGIVHIGYVGMPQCDPTPGQPLGNWVWIDHGGGVVSRYAHLYQIQVQDGQQVTVSTVLGKSGSSGEAKAQCRIKYLNYQVQHGATGGRPNGTGFAFKYSYACSGANRVTYPTALYSGRYPTWNQFPKSTFVSGQGWQNMIPRGGVGCVP